MKQNGHSLSMEWCHEHIHSLQLLMSRFSVLKASQIQGQEDFYRQNSFMFRKTHICFNVSHGVLQGRMYMQSATCGLFYSDAIHSNATTNYILNDNRFAQNDYSIWSSLMGYLCRFPSGLTSSYYPAHQGECWLPDYVGECFHEIILHLQPCKPQEGSSY